MEGLPSCIICNSSDGNLIQIKQRAIDGLIDSSKKRRDQRYKTFGKYNVASIHDSCRKNYNRSTSIEAAVNLDGRRKSAGKKLVSEAQKFNFDSQCIFCASACDEKEEFRVMQKDETKEKILNELQVKDKTDYNKQILARLNLLGKKENATRGRYHKRCMNNFYTCSFSTNVGRPSSAVTVNFIKHCIDFIRKNPDECQFSLEEMKTGYTGDIPCLTTIKSKLSEHFNDDLLYIAKKKDPIIIFKKTVSQHLNDRWYNEKKRGKKKG